MEAFLSFLSFSYLTISPAFLLFSLANFNKVIQPKDLFLQLFLAFSVTSAFIEKEIRQININDNKAFMDKIYTFEIQKQLK